MQEIYSQDGEGDIRLQKCPQEYAAAELELQAFFAPAVDGLAVGANELWLRCWGVVGFVGEQAERPSSVHKLRSCSAGVTLPGLSNMGCQLHVLACRPSQPEGTTFLTCGE